MKDKLHKAQGFFSKLPKRIKDLYLESKEQFFIMLQKCQDLAHTNYELGIYHINNGNMSDAKLRFMMVTKLKPELALAHYHLARCHMFNLEFEKAKQELETALTLDPKLEVAAYRLKLVTKTVKNTPVPLQIIQEDYNCLSKKYEDYMLNQQKYAGPELLAAAIKKQIDAAKLTEISHNILDIGCGTGIVGAELTQIAHIKTLIGIDISTNLLKLAKDLSLKNKIVYNSVKEVDFNNLSPLPHIFDIITACLSLGYSKDITIILKNIETIAVDRAILGIVVLKSTSNDVEFNYDNDCYSFNEEYIISSLKNTNWQITHKEEIQLFADGTLGLMFILKKQGTK